MAKLFVDTTLMGALMPRKFTDDEVLDILCKHEDGMTITELALEYGVSYHSIYRMVTGESYKHISPGIGVTKPKIHPYEVVSLIERNYSTTAVAAELGVSNTTVSKIYKKATGRTVREFRRQHAVRYGDKVNG